MHAFWVVALGLSCLFARARVSLVVFASLRWQLSEAGVADTSLRWQRCEACVADEAFLERRRRPPANGKHQRDAGPGESAERAPVAFILQLLLRLLLLLLHLLLALLGCDEVQRDVRVSSSHGTARMAPRACCSASCKRAFRLRWRAASATAAVSAWCTAAATAAAASVLASMAGAAVDLSGRSTHDELKRLRNASVICAEMQQVSLNARSPCAVWSFVCQTETTRT